MRKILLFIACILICGCSESGDKNYSHYKHGPYQYKVLNDDGSTLYTTYRQYMFDEGFPDSIIVRVTRDGEFQGYEVAYRRDVIEDSLGNVISPAYVISSVVGDNVVYNLKGEFVQYNESSLPHSGQGDPDHTWNP